MQDKSFLQALQDLEDRFSSNFQESIDRMLLHRMTAVNATVDIKDENMRAVITNALTCSQIISLLTLMRDLRFLDEAQCSEFTAYLQRSFSSQHDEFSSLWRDLQ